jgi:hypothetical protein
MSVINRRNRQFVIDQEYIKPENRTSDVINGLYAAIYEEFAGAQYNIKYEKLTIAERMECLNTFATDWLKARGYYQV